MGDGADSRSSELSDSGRSPGVSSSTHTASPDVGYVLPSDDKTVISKRPSSVPVAAPVPMKPADVGRSLIGEMLGHFKLEEFVGGGGMGAVFRATDTMLGRTVAVKVVSNDMGDEELLRRFRNEAQSAARLDHPNIARVYYVGEDNQWNYIVFEYIEGVNIRDLVEHKGPLPLAEAVSYALQVSQALEHAAQRDVVHRDIKPSNILVMPDGRAKLVDMGLARLHQVDAPSQDLTATGVTLGTFDYISPEQARDPRSADVRSDLYSLGCTLYYMLTGMPPFPEGTVLQKLLSHSSDPPPDPRELRAELDDELCAISLKLMAKQPSQRHQTPAELTEALFALAERLGLPHERQGQVVPMAGANRSPDFVTHIPWIVPCVLLLVMIGGAELLLPRTGAIREDEQRSSDVTAASRPIAQATPFDPATTSVEARSGQPAPPPSPPSEAASEKPEATPATAGNESVPAGDGSTGAVRPVASASSTPKASEPTGRPSDDGGRVPAPSASANQVTVVPTANAESTAINPGTHSDVVPDTTSPVTGTTPAVSSRPKVLTVSPDENTSESQQLASSLAGAIEMAKLLPEVDTIELRFQRRTERPLRLAARSEQSELTIRAAAGYTPVLRFRPSSEDLLHDHSMLQLIGGKVNFIGIHFRVELEEPLADDWTLFDLKQVDRVTFQNCTFTFQNDFGATASFFYVEGAPLSRMMPDTASGMGTRFSPPTIEMTSCVARGQANLVRAVEGLPFRLTWNQGFLATTVPAFFARGLKDSGGAQRIDISLQHVTASLQDRFCLVEIDSMASFVPWLTIDCSHCVFDVRDESIPFVEHRGIDDPESLTRNLYRQLGETNHYAPYLQTRWRIETLNAPRLEFGWRPRADWDWYKEGASEHYTPWRGALPGEGKPVYAYSHADFRLNATVASMAGFDETVLPVPPDN